MTQLNFLFFLASIVVVMIAIRVFTLLLISARSSYLTSSTIARELCFYMYELAFLFIINNILKKKKEKTINKTLFNFLGKKRKISFLSVQIIKKTLSGNWLQNIIIFSPHLLIVYAYFQSFISIDMSSESFIILNNTSGNKLLSLV